MKHITKIIAVVLSLLLLAGCASSGSGSAALQEQACDAVTVESGKWCELRGFDEDPRGLAIHVSHPDQFTYKLTANDGCLFVEEISEFVSSVTLKDGEAIGWMSCTPLISLIPWLGSITYVDMIIYKDDLPVGYDVVQVLKDADYDMYSAELLKCVTFSDGLGGYPNVSEAQIAELIAQVKTGEA